jgi:hypothetical protein
VRLGRVNASNNSYKLTRPRGRSVRGNSGCQYSRSAGPLACADGKAGSMELGTWSKTAKLYVLLSATPGFSYSPLLAPCSMLLPNSVHSSPADFRSLTMLSRRDETQTARASCLPERSPTSALAPFPPPVRRPSWLLPTGYATSSVPISLGPPVIANSTAW